MNGEMSSERLVELKAFVELVKRMIQEEWSVTGTFGDDGIEQACKDADDIAALLSEKPASAPAAGEPQAIAARLAAAGHVAQLRSIVEAMASDENNMAEAAAREDARGAARDYAGVLAQQRRLPRHCQWCAWRPDERVYYMREPLKRCLACGLWLCAACDYAHNCPGTPETPTSAPDAE